MNGLTYILILKSYRSCDRNVSVRMLIWNYTKDILGADFIDYNQLKKMDFFFQKLSLRLQPWLSLVSNK